MLTVLGDLGAISIDRGRLYLSLCLLVIFLNSAKMQNTFSFLFLSTVTRKLSLSKPLCPTPLHSRRPVRIVLIYSCRPVAILPSTCCLSVRFFPSVAQELFLWLELNNLTT